MISEEPVGNALPLFFISPAGEDLNRQKVNLIVFAEFDEESGDCAKTNRPFEKADLMRMQIVKIESFAPRRLRVIKYRASMWGKQAAIIRLGLRFRDESAPVGQLAFPDQPAQFGRRDAIFLRL